MSQWIFRWKPSLGLWTPSMISSNLCLRRSRVWRCQIWVSNKKFRGAERAVFFCWSFGNIFSRFFFVVRCFWVGVLAKKCSRSWSSEAGHLVCLEDHADGMAELTAAGLLAPLALVLLSCLIAAWLKTWETFNFWIYIVYSCFFLGRVGGCLGKFVPNSGLNQLQFGTCNLGFISFGHLDCPPKVILAAGGWENFRFLLVNCWPLKGREAGFVRDVFFNYSTKKCSKELKFGCFFWKPQWWSIHHLIELDSSMDFWWLSISPGLLLLHRQGHGVAKKQKIRYHYVTVWYFEMMLSIIKQQ